MAHDHHCDPLGLGRDHPRPRRRGARHVGFPAGLESSTAPVEYRTRSRAWRSWSSPWRAAVRARGRSPAPLPLPAVHRRGVGVHGLLYATTFGIGLSGFVTGLRTAWPSYLRGDIATVPDLGHVASRGGPRGPRVRAPRPARPSCGRRDGAAAAEGATRSPGCFRPARPPIGKGTEPWRSLPSCVVAWRWCGAASFRCSCSSSSRWSFGSASSLL